MRTIILIFLYYSLSFAQESDSIKSKKNFLPEIGLGTGVLSFDGDIGKDTKVSIYGSIRWGANFFLEKKINNFFSVRVNTLYGKVAKNEHVNNFESPIIQTGLSLIFDFDNNLIIHKNSKFSPFFAFGISYLKFDPHGDLEDANGNKYYFWSDGTIRNQAQTDSTVATAKIISRDYVYESTLKSTEENYKRNTLTVPFTAGLKFKLCDFLNARISASYINTMSDYIDNQKNNNNNDKIIYTSFSLQFNFNKMKNKNNAEDEKYKDVDFNSLIKQDSDGDGISDINDNCQNTPKQAKVDKNGCPIDSDNDGVPDYKDKEKNTPKGKIVDENGVSISDEELAKISQLRDSLATERSKVFFENPSLKTLMAIEKQQKEEKTKTFTSQTEIPAEFKDADYNNDGYISASEVTRVIDEFFEGENNFNVEKIHKLIDFFFEQ